MRKRFMACQTSHKAMRNSLFALDFCTVVYGFAPNVHRTMKLRFRVNLFRNTAKNLSFYRCCSRIITLKYTPIKNKYLLLHFASRLFVRTRE